MEKERELQLARLVVERGLVAPDDLRECLSEQLNEQYEKGAQARTLSTILVDRGLLSRDDLARIHVQGTAPTIAAVSAPPRLPPPMPRAQHPAITPATKSKMPSDINPTLPLAPPASPGSDLPDEAIASGRDPRNQFGKFILVDQLGAGGFGAVYKAWQRDLTRWVAIKFLHSEDPADVQRFVREAQTAAKLTHPGIVGIYEVAVIARRTYIAMEFIDGRPLSKAKLTPEQSVKSLVQAARAVQYAHERGVVHRDLKPANLLYDVTGRVCVMDFGLARNVNAAGTLTMSGTIVGTPAYMSPEQAHGSKTVSALSDVYSLGATLYDLLTGRTPFQGQTPYEIVRKVIDSEPEPPRRINPKIHADIETIVLKALEKDPAKRYASAGAMADDIERHLAGEPIQARPIGAVERIWKKVKRNPVVSAALAVAVLAVTAGATVGALLLVERARSMEAAAEAARRELVAGREKMEADAKLVSAERASAKIALMVSDVERLRVGYYRPSFTSRDYQRQLAWLEKRIADLRKDLPDRPEPDYLLGRLYLEAEELDKAKESLERAVRIDPKFGPAHAAYARCLFEHIVEYIYLALVYAEGIEHAAQWRREYEMACDLAAAGTWAELPGSATDRALLGLLKLIYAGEYEKMLKACEKGWSDTHDEEFLRYQAFPAVTLGRHTDGIQTMGEAIEVRPGWATVYVYRAVLYAVRSQANPNLEDLLQADKDVKKALELNPRSHLAHRCNGYKLRVVGQLKAAAEAYTEAIRIRPTALYYFERIDVWRTWKKWDEALKDADESVKRWPQMATAWALRADVRRLRSELDGALSDAEQAMKLKPHLLNARQAMADVLGRLGRWDEAVATATWLVEHVKGHAEGVGMRGIVRKRWADELRRKGEPGWKDLLLQAREDLDAYVASKAGKETARAAEAKKARAEIEALLQGP